MIIIQSFRNSLSSRFIFHSCWSIFVDFSNQTCIIMIRRAFANWDDFLFQVSPVYLLFTSHLILLLNYGKYYLVLFIIPKISTVFSQFRLKFKNFARRQFGDLFFWISTRLAFPTLYQNLHHKMIAKYTISKKWNSVRGGCSLLIVLLS